MQLYRGFRSIQAKTKMDNKFIKEPRLPAQTRIKVHNVADRWFFRKFGIHARSSTIICSTDYIQAAKYGYLYKVTPSGKYKLIYSSDVHDFIDIETSDIKINDSQEIEKWLESKSYVSTENVDHISNDFFGEVMLYCETYDIEPMFTS